MEQGIELSKSQAVFRLEFAFSADLWVEFSVSVFFGLGSLYFFGGRVFSLVGWTHGSGGNAVFGKIFSVHTQRRGFGFFLASGGQGLVASSWLRAESQEE